MNERLVISTDEQRSTDWFRARGGCITASYFHELRADKRLKSGPKKGQFNAKASYLAFKLAIERISGMVLEVDDGFTPWQAKRGIELEPHARLQHELKYDILVERAGFIKTEDGKFGASADGFTDRDGLRRGCEYKCYLSPEKLQDILLTGSTNDVIDQCDGGMWITGLDAWDFGLYCPALSSIGLDFVLTPILRNDDRIEALETDLLQFDNLVEECVVRLKQRAGVNSLQVSQEAPYPERKEINRELAATLPVKFVDIPEDPFA